MSKDIRSYFQLKKPNKPNIEDDDDVIPESPDVQIKNKKKDIKKRRVIDDDSDEDIFSTNKKKKTITETIKSTKNKDTKKTKPPLKEIKAVDIFGSAPIKRTEPLVKKEKKKNTELGIHSDEELEKTLLEIDSTELEPDTTDKVNYNENSNKIDDIKPNEKLKNHDRSPNKSEKPSSSKMQRKTNTESSKLLPSDETSSKNNKDVPKDKEKDYNRSEIKINKKDNVQDVKTSKSEKHNHKSASVDSNDSDKKSKMDNSKRKFAEFIENDNHDDHGTPKKTKIDDNHVSENNSDNKKQELDSNSSFLEDEDKPKKKKLNKSLNDSVLTDEERHERRRHSAALYKSYLNRSGPKHLGSKEMPEGTPVCLKDCAFVLTGVLDSFEKDEVTSAINKFGGCVKSGVTKKVTHVLAGDEPGPAKIAKAEELGIKIINEDEFLKMIVDRSQKKTNKEENKKDIKKEKSPNKKSNKESSTSKITDKNNSDKSDKHHKESKTSLNNKLSKDNHVNNKTKKSPSDKIKSETSSKEKIKVNTNNENSKHGDKSKSPRKVKEEIKEQVKSEDKPSTNKIESGISNEDVEKKANSLMWVEKYKPQNVKQIIGQHGDASNVKKLTNWLTKWYVNRKAKLNKPSPWAKNDDGGYFKAALLSGPPGVGKTTTVSLVCKDLGFDTVEFNASDTRNKTLIKEQIGELLTTTSLSAYAKGATGKQAVTKKHVLVMDEVDGMAGNEDRGGLQELIGLIKNTSVPIICMCNDRNSQKMRSLVNYCYDLRFSRPRVDQIRSAMMSICFKEGIKIPPDALAQLISSANQDVRQTLNLLSMWAIEPSLADADRLRNDAKTVKKDVKLGPWDAIRKVFSAEEHKTMSINDKSDLFFYDYSLAPLFAQENYLQVEPHCPKHEKLQRISDAADSISLGDLVDSRIRRQQAWSLLPLQAMYSSVIPGHRLSGHVTGQIQFPGWLGKNSRASKMHRLCQEIHAHTRLSTSGSKSSIFLDYSSHLRDAIVNPLVKDKADGINESLEVLEAYHLLREDLDSLVELSVWPGQRNPTILIDSKVKAAMTRTYNKKATALPYAPGVVKKGRANDATDEYDELAEQDDDDEQRDSDPENDALIKKKKSTKDTEKPSTSKSEKVTKPSTSRKKKEK